jgi:hypothetical protein
LKPINKNEMYNRESHGESKELDNGWFRPHFYAGLLLVFSQIRFLFYNFGICSLHFAVCWVCSTVWHNKQSNKNKLKIMLCKQIVLLPKNVQYHCYWNCNWVSKCKKNIFNTLFLYLNYYSKGVSKSVWKFWLEITLKISNFFNVLLCF